MTPFYSKTLYIFFITIIISFTACNDPVSDVQIDEIATTLVVNEGNWSDGNGSITSVDPESGQITQEKFQKKNGRPLAGIIQSTTRYGDRFFIVANNANKIEVTDAASTESIATITFGEDSGITPAGLAVASESKGYISSLYDHSVYTVDLENYEVTGSGISVGANPGGLVIVGDLLYVANSGFGDDNTVTVIDTKTDDIMATLEVGNGPARLIADNQGRIWVVCNGKKAYDEDWNRDFENDIPGRIDVLDAANATVITTIQTGGFPKALAFNEQTDQAWVVNEESVQQINMYDYELVDDSFIGRSFNGIGYSTAEDHLYLAQSNGYVQAGQAIIFNMNATAIDSFATGIAPIDFLFLVEID